VRVACPQPRRPLLRLLILGLSLAAGTCACRYRPSPRATARPPGTTSPAQPPPSPIVPVTDRNLEVKNPSLLDVVVHPDGDVVIAVGTEGTLLRSDDGGASYAKVEAHTREALVGGIALRERGSILVIGSGGTLLRSIDHGRTFAQVAVETEAPLTAIAESRSGTIVVVGDHGVALASMDHGEHFIREDTGRTHSLTELVALAAYPGGFVAAGEAGSIVLRDADGRWFPVESPSRTFVTALEGLADGSLLAGLAEGLIVRSTDSGVHWQETFGSRDQNYVLGFVSSPDGTVVLARLHDRTLVRSEDGGRTFAPVDLPRAKAPTALTWLPGRGFVGVAGDGGTVRSDLRGAVWTHTAASQPMRATKVVVDPKAGSVLGVGAAGFIGRLAPAAARFDVIAQDLGGLIRALVQAPDTGTLVAVGLDATVVRSVDGGKTYQRRPTTIAPTSELAALTYDPGHSSFILATTSGTVYRSQDDGQSFRKSTELGHEVLQLALVGNGRVLALCAGHGGRLSTDGGKSFGPTSPGLSGTLRYAAPGCARNSVLAVGDGGALFHSTNNGAAFQRIDSSVSSTLRYFACGPGSDRVWVVGDHGTLLHSEDATTRIRRVPVPTDENLFTAGLSNDGNVLLVGGNGGTLLRSTDGGQSFASVATGSRQPVRIAAFVPDFHEFLIAGVGGLLMMTSNQTHPRRFAGRFEGRFDHWLYHAATRSLVITGDRLLRLGLP
jgi:photosystem II stability/assembly factor-like uncharacterized protein